MSARSAGQRLTARAFQSLKRSGTASKRAAAALATAGGSCDDDDADSGSCASKGDATTWESLLSVAPCRLSEGAPHAHLLRPAAADSVPVSKTYPNSQPVSRGPLCKKNPKPKDCVSFVKQARNFGLATSAAADEERTEEIHRRCVQAILQSATEWPIEAYAI